MKTKLWVLLLCLALLAGCGESGETKTPAEESGLQNREPITVPASAGDLPIADASESPVIIAPEAETGEEGECPKLLESLLNGAPFIHVENGERREMYLEGLYHTGTEQEMALENRNYALIDLDEDGVDELVLSLAMADSVYPYGFEIIHISEFADALMGYSVYFRAMNELRTDGSFTASSGAYDWGIYKIESFGESGYSTKALAWCESAADENAELVLSYYVGGEVCDEAEFLMAVEEMRDAAEPVEFHSFNMETWDSSFVAEEESEYILSNGLKLGLSYNEIKEIAGLPQMKETMELEVANFYKLFYRGLGVLTLCASPGESIEDASLLCIQILEKGTETAHGIEVGADLKTLHEAGLEPTEENGFFAFNFPSIASGDTMAYDGTVELYNGLAGIEEGRQLFYMMSNGLVTSILIRPAVALDAFPPVYPPLLGDSISLYPNELVGEQLSELDRITVKSWVNNGGEKLLEYEHTLSNFQMTMLTQLFAELSIQQLSAPPEVQMNDYDRNYEITLHFSDGESSVFQTADEGALIYYGEGDVWFASKSEAMKEFLKTHYRWSKYDLNFMEW